MHNTALPLPVKPCSKVEFLVLPNYLPRKRQ